MKTFALTSFSETFHLALRRLRYADNSPALQVITDESQPFATLSVWFPSSVLLEDDTFFLKDWSENEVLADVMIEQGLIEEVENGFQVKSGYVVSSVYRLTEKGKEYIV